MPYVVADASAIIEMLGTGKLAERIAARLFQNAHEVHVPHLIIWKSRWRSAAICSGRDARLVRSSGHRASIEYID